MGVGRQPHNLQLGQSKEVQRSEPRTVNILGGGQIHAGCETQTKGGFGNPLGAYESRPQGLGGGLIMPSLSSRFVSLCTVSQSKAKLTVNVEATQDGLTGSTFTVGQKWEESSSCGELVEALHNYTACVFQIRPWDWSGILWSVGVVVY